MDSVSQQSSFVAEGTLVVRYWFVCEDRQDEDGRLIHGFPLSPKFDSNEKAERELLKAEGRHPEAVVCECARFFNQSSAAGVTSRERLVASLV